MMSFFEVSTNELPSYDLKKRENSFSTIYSLSMPSTIVALPIHILILVSGAFDSFKFKYL